jgi:S-adenosylmethionine decarboxylase
MITEDKVRAHGVDETGNIVGQHLLLTLSGCRPDRLNDEALLLKTVREAAIATGATVLEVRSHSFQPQGFTAMVMLSESHASLHTYPERGIAFWDCFTCGLRCHPEDSIAKLVEALKPESVCRQIVRRSAV